MPVLVAIILIIFVFPDYFSRCFTHFEWQCYAPKRTHSLPTACHHITVSKVITTLMILSSRLLKRRKRRKRRKSKESKESKERKERKHPESYTRLKIYASLSHLRKSFKHQYVGSEKVIFMSSHRFLFSLISLISMEELHKVYVNTLKYIQAIHNNVQSKRFLMRCDTTFLDKILYNSRKCYCLRHQWHYDYIANGSEDYLVSMNLYTSTEPCNIISVQWII